MKNLVIILALSLKISGALAQARPPLEREVSISFENEKIDVALARLSQEAKLTFSYSPSILDLNQSVSGTFSGKSVREILNQILGESVTAKERGNYVILKKAPVPVKRASNENPGLQISGYVYNDETGEKMPEVSVYDRKTLTAAVTNQFGFFKLKIDKADSAEIAFNKRSFMDTVVQVTSTNAPVFMNVPLRLERIEVAMPSLPDTVSTESLQPEEDLRSTKESDINMWNIRDTLYRDFQVSFVPFIGTNDKLSGNVINNYSVNILGGYSLGTRELEIGGLFNIDRGDVARFQAAGLFNLVGGTVTGFQAAGLGNMNKGRVKAAQFAGLYNINGDEVRGPQFAGLFNLNVKEARGPQFAGLFNVQAKDYHGSQFAGLFNIGAHRVTGTQISGLLNLGKKVHGSQIGFINFSDSIRGVPVGFLSFSAHGYHKLEVAADEVFYTNVAFRTGVHQFYNILTAGMKPERTIGNENIWSFGYGIGTAPKVFKWLYLNFDATSSHVNQGSFTHSLSLLNKVYMGLDFQLSKGFSVTAGVTLNGYLSDTSYSDNPTLFTSYQPRFIYDHTYSNSNNLKMWWGAKVGLRFF